MKRKTKRKSPRHRFEAFACCGSHGGPWVHHSGPSAQVGQMAIFEKYEDAMRGGGAPVHRVTLLIERERCDTVLIKLKQG